MAEKQFIYFYRIENQINSNFYYGVHKTFNLEDGYMGSGVRIQRAVKKYGKENFNKEILLFFDTFDEALDYEATVVTENLLKNAKCYNLKRGGEGGSIKGRTSPMKGKHHTKETIQKIKIGNLGISKNKGVKRSIETKQKISINNGMHNNGKLITGEKNGQYGIKGDKNHNYNTIWIYNDILKITRRIKEEEISKFIAEDWKKGRKIKWN